MGKLSRGGVTTENYQKTTMTSESSGGKAPPPYLIGTTKTGDGQGGDVTMYHVHTPFPNVDSTLKNPSYQVQTAGNAYSESKQKFTSYDNELGRTPGMTTCTACQQQVMTNVTYKVGTYAWLMCLLFICCGLVIGCCLIPFFVKYFKDAYHTCPRCNRVLHVEKKKCC
ncbi:hypothetical protein GJAV_G00217410 [Gymnothorax javanicus]|nr:hypothetical protein GJAV_G00217410 [Gymnothorax javanicus]